ncbi:tetratricopeptide repeat protein [Hydrogenothermus marinus]|uniref:Sel1 repeat-containing protein n=1 Tax=Hydrogenothermus marinus TaxID=133270 RepID=A0A3M0BRZ0_9AQUI|nr:tetratricopeptide repeat protein [Hydrogenothermus marinus]RMA97265.1 Sel1 repeat-containing protein [Hydrogenothermus marinus]
MKKQIYFSLLFFVFTAFAEDNFEKARKALNEKNYNLAISLLKEDCSNNIGKSCEFLGQIYDEGLGVNKDYNKAKYYYEKACKLNESFGCNNLGYLYETVNKDYNKAKYYYKKACNLGYKKACGYYAELKNIENIPKPFGLVVGKTTQEEFLRIVKERNWNISNKGYRIIKDDVSNPNIYGYFIDNINLKYLDTAKFWFYKGILMKIDYELSEDMGKNTFKVYYDKLKAKYGAPAIYREPYLAEGLAEWNFGNVKVILRVPWVSTYTYLTYEDIKLTQEADKDDEEYYKSYIQKTSKDIEGL